MQHVAFAGIRLLRGLYPVHKSDGLLAVAGANTTVMPAKRQKSASTPKATPSGRHQQNLRPAAAFILSANRCRLLQYPSAISFLLLDVHSQLSQKRSRKIIVMAILRIISHY